MKTAQTITDLNTLIINRIVQLERELDAQIITAGTFADNTKMLLRVYRREKERINGYEVEKEKKYLVKAPHTASNYYTKSSRHRIGIAIRLTTSDIAREDDLFHFTEKEINELLPDVPEKYWEEIK